MNLENWHTIEHKTSDGDEFGLTALPNHNVRAVVNKNWLHLLDTDSWRDEMFTEDPLVARVMDGNLQYGGGVNVVVEQGPQNGVYAIVTTGFKQDDTFEAMATCGVYDPNNNGVSVDAESYLFDLVEQSEDVSQSMFTVESSYKQTVLDE